MEEKFEKGGKIGREFIKKGHMGIQEGWGGFLLPEFPLFSKEGAGGDFNPPSIPLCERGKKGDLEESKKRISQIWQNQ